MDMRKQKDKKDNSIEINIFVFLVLLVFKPQKIIDLAWLGGGCH